VGGGLHLVKKPRKKRSQEDGGRKVISSHVSQQGEKSEIVRKCGSNVAALIRAQRLISIEQKRGERYMDVEGGTTQVESGH